MDNTIQISEVSQRQKQRWEQHKQGIHLGHVVNIHIAGTLALPNLQKALDALVARHEVLRTTYYEDEFLGMLSQAIAETGTWELEDRGPATPEEVAQAANGLAQGGGLAPQAQWWQVGEGGQLLLYVSALLVDEASWTLLLGELSELWSGETPEAEVVAFGKYADWHNKVLAEGDSEAEAFWQDHQKALPPLAALPFQQDNKGSDTEISNGLTEEETEAWFAWCEEQDLSPEDALFAVWSLVLAKHSGTQQFSIYKNESFRSYEAFENIIGPIAQALPVAVKLGKGAFEAWAESLEEDLEDLREWQDNYAALEDDPAAAWGFQYLDARVALPEGWAIQEVQGSQNQFGLSLQATVLEETLRLQIIHGGQSVSAASAEFLLARVRECVLGAVAGQRMEALLQVSAEEGALQKETFATRGAAEVPFTSVIEAFEHQVSQQPAAIALAYPGTQLSFQQVEEKANQLAHFLIDTFQLGAGQRAAVRMQRSPDLIISFLAILKTGASYLPIDFHVPAERLHFILKDSNAAVLVQADMYQTPDNLPAPVVGLHEMEMLLEAAYTSRPAVEIPGDATCYTIYTSGSTGTPKGVAVSHDNLANYLHWFGTEYDITPKDATLLFSSVAFDLGYTALWSALAYGATLHLLKEDAYLDLTELMNQLRAEPITYIKLTPSHLGMIVQDADFAAAIPDFNLRLIVTGGEAIQMKEVEQYLSADPDAVFVNHYGPTETTIGTVAHTITADTLVAYQQAPVIGRPITNNRGYLLNDAGELVPTGIAGELCIAGAGVAQGYVNREELTAQSFVAHAALGESRLYKTGDLARWMPDGTLQFLGRKDHQIKIRGYRVELGEIEQALTDQEGISMSAVILHKGNQGDQLVAYHNGTGLSEDTLREVLEARLPEYMVPARLIAMTDFTLTGNGKVDRKALPNPDEVTQEAGDYVAPTNEKEQVIASVWAEILGIDRVGITDNFFRIGGDSIKAIQVAARLTKEGFKLQVFDIFQQPDVMSLAAIMREGQEAMDQTEVTGDIPMSPIQARFFRAKHGQEHHFNQSLMLQGSFSAEAVTAVFTKLMEHHDALRTVAFRLDSGKYEQEVKPVGMAVALEEKELRGETSPEEALWQHANALQQGIDLQNGPLIRLGLYHMDADDRLLVVIHHLIIDGVSWRVFLEDVETLFDQYQKGEALSLPSKTHSFQRWVGELQAYGETEALRHELPYWQGIEQAAPQGISTEVSTTPIAGRKQVNVQVPATLTKSLLTEAHGAYHTEINDLLLAALSRALGQTFERDALAISLEGHGRENISDVIDVSRTLGWFTTVYPVLLNGGQAAPVEDLIIGMKENLRNIPLKGIGYGILRYLNGAALSLDTDISFNYLGQFEGTTDTSDIRVASEGTGDDISPERPAFYALTVVGLVRDGQLRLSFDYDPALLQKSQVDALASAYQTALEELVSHCLSVTNPQRTPADFTYTELSLDAVKNLESRWDIEDIYPLSPMQQGIYFHYQQAVQDAYYRQVSYRVQGILDSDKVASAFNTIVARHDLLRALVPADLEVPVQVILKERKADFYFEDLRKSADPETLVSQFLKADRKRSFHLEKDNLLRIAVLQVADNQYELMWAYHHLVIDGWCLGIITGEFFEAYNALLQNRKPELPVARSYKQYLRWLHKRPQEEALQHWTQQLSDYDSLATLPRPTADRPSGYRREHISLTLTAEKTAALNQLAAEKATTLNTLVQTLWGVLLSYYSGKNDVVFGSIVSGRPAEIPGVDTMVGLFINTIPVRVKLESEQTLMGAVAKLQEANAKSTPYHHTQLAHIQQAAGLGQGLLDHFIGFQNFPIEQVMADEAASGSDKKGLELEVLGTSLEEQTSFDYYLMAVPGEQLHMDFSYNALVFDRGYFETLISRFNRLISQLLETPDLKVKDIQFLTAKEQGILLSGFNPNPSVQPKQATLTERFAAAVATHSQATALVSGDVRLTYAALDTLSNKVAQGLHQDHGVGKGQVVALLQERNEHMIIAMLAVAKTGAAWLPIDAKTPAARLQTLLQESQAQVLLTQDTLTVDTGEWTGTTLAVDDPNHWKHEAEPLSVNIQPEDPVYVIYTSGSTGTPKGVVVPHQGLAIYLAHFVDHYQVKPHDATLLFTSYAFDLGYTSIWGALTTGIKLVLMPEAAGLDRAAWLATMEQENISLLKLSPAHLNLLVNDPDFPQEVSKLSLRALILGGEALRKVDVRKYLDAMPATLVVDEYGPTEATIGCIARNINVNNWETYIEKPSIGLPFAGHKAVLLDSFQRLVPMGVPGELYLYGAGLAHGYQNQPALTAEKFVQHPLVPGATLYRTGDLVRVNDQYEFDFLGRIDQQIKVRGYRIEIGEMEHAIVQHPAVKDAVVMVVQGSQPDARLVAYYQAISAVEEVALQDHIRMLLPSYMMPDVWVALDKMPLTANGKVDRKALPAVQALSVAYEAPANEIEATLAAIWQDVLAVARVGRQDHFFHLGGHSLKVMQVIARISKQLGHRITLSDAFERPLLHQLAALLRGDADTQEATITVLDKAEHYPISHAQRRLWILDQFERNLIHYNIYGAFRITGALDAEALEKALHYLVERHESLRTTFTAIAGDPHQVIHTASEFGFALKREDVGGKATTESLQALVTAEAETPFNLTEGPLFRATLVHNTATDHLLIFALHHIIADGWSIDILVKELQEAYSAFAVGDVPSQKPLRIQYKDFAGWQNAELVGDSLEQHQQHWHAAYASLPTPLDLPTDRPRPTVKTTKGTTLHVPLSKAAWEAAQQLGNEQESTLFMTLQAAVKTLLYRYSGQSDVVVGVPVAGRDHAELEDQIGFYVNTLPMRSTFSGLQSFASFLQQVKDETLAGFSHQVYPFDRLIDDLNITSDLSRNPLFDVVVSLQNTPVAAAMDEGIQGLHISGFQADADISKFDLVFNFAETENGLSLALQFNTDLFDQDRIERSIGHLEQLLVSAAAAPDKALDQLSLLTEQELSLLDSFNDTEVPYDREASLAQHFERQVDANPDKRAVVFGEQQLTYTELETRANQLAHLLMQDFGVGKGTVVGLQVQVHLDMVVAIMAILKAGGAYLPVDPKFPTDRQVFMLTDGGARLLIYDSVLPEGLDLEAQPLADLVERSSAKPQNRVAGQATPEDLAYLVYTSGSTGTPKGVMTPQRGVARLVKCSNDFGFSPDDRMMQLSNFVFDGSMHALFGALLNGGEMHLLDQNTTLSVQRQAAYIAEHEINNFFITTALFNALMEEAPQVVSDFKGSIAFGGEAALPHYIERALAHGGPDFRLVHVYGPTECTVYALGGRLTHAETPIHIGRPIANTTAHILDPAGNQVPVGVIGEICLGGEGLTHGYLNRPELNAEKFFTWKGQRLYRSGDQGRWTSEGNVIFEGRKDRQIKLRGFRIELGEIEQALRAMPTVSSAAVDVREVAGDRKLVAWLMAPSEIDTMEVKKELAEQLPAFMVPSFLLTVPEIPLNVNGKVDFKQLPDPEQQAPAAEKISPRTEVEKLLAGMWSEVLWIDNVGVTDNFFELGGHSIKATQLISRIAKQWEVQVELRDLFEQPTIAGLAQHLEGLLADTQDADKENTEMEDFVL